MTATIVTAFGYINGRFKSVLRLCLQIQLWRPEDIVDAISTPDRPITSGYDCGCSDATSKPQV